MDKRKELENSFPATDIEDVQLREGRIVTIAAHSDPKQPVLQVPLPNMLLLSPGVLTAVAVLSAVIFLVRRVTSPLWKLPGPTISAFTSLQLKLHELRANRTVYVHQLHLEYGPVVRIAPNEVSFTSWAAVKEIYCSGGSGYDKTEFYDLFQIYGRRTMFTTLNKADVGQNRQRSLWLHS